MITITNASKIQDKEIKKGLFQLISISSTSKIEVDGKAVPMLSRLAPKASLLNKRVAGKIKKKEFEKKYRKYLEKSDVAYYELQMLIRTITRTDRAIALVLSDKEYEMDFHKILEEYINEICGVEFMKIKKVQNTITDELKAAMKKGKKKGKGKKKKISDEKVAKVVNKLLDEYLTIDSTGRDFLKEAGKYFKLEMYVATLASKGIIMLGKEELVIDTKKFKKKHNVKDVKKLIKKAAGSKRTKDIVKRICEESGIKFKKLDKELSDMSLKDCIRFIHAISEEISVEMYK